MSKPNTNTGSLILSSKNSKSVLVELIVFALLGALSMRL
jgi:hypothetical protein